MYEIILKDMVFHWVVDQHPDNEEWIYILACEKNFVLNPGKDNEQRQYKIKYIPQCWDLHDKNLITF